MAGPSRRDVLLLIAAGLLPISVVAADKFGGSPIVRSTVSLTEVAQATDPTYAGVCSSTLGRLPTDPQQGQAEKTLDARCFRVPVRWNGAAIVSSARGSNNRPIEATVKTYYSWPGVRMLLVVAGRDGDWMGYQSGDAYNIVSRLQALGMTDMNRFDVSGANEPDQNGAASMSDVASRCIQIAAELRAAGAGGKVWGPAWSNPDGDFEPFARQVGAGLLAGIDWHSYPGGTGTAERSVQHVLSEVARQASVITRVRKMLSKNGLPAHTNVDELNWTWQMGHTPALFTAANTVMLALGYCAILSAGGRCMTYATQNGELSVMADSYGNPDGRPQSSPMPAYWGIAALTGANLPGQAPLFPHYKDTFCTTTSDDPGVKVFAVNNEANGFNLIVINTSEDSDKYVALAVSGMDSGSYELFQTVRRKPYDPPRKAAAAAAFSTRLLLRSPALTVSMIVLKPQSGAP